MDDDQERAFDYVQSLNKAYEDYGHRKERETYVTAALYLAVTGAVVTHVGDWDLLPRGDGAPDGSGRSGVQRSGRRVKYFGGECCRQHVILPQKDDRAPRLPRRPSHPSLPSPFACLTFSAAAGLALGAQWYGAAGALITAAAVMSSWESHARP